MHSDAQVYRKSATAHLEEANVAAALEDAWRALAADPNSRESKKLVSKIFTLRPLTLTSDAVPAFHRLLLDPEFDPQTIAASGWRYLLQECPALRSTPAELAALLEGDNFARDLLSEALVTVPEAESTLTRLRRWLLLENRWAAFPRTAGALQDQAQLSGGAWPFDAAEAAALAGSGQFALAYRARPEQSQARDDLADIVTRAVAEQYEGWPYPQWTRITWTRPRLLAEDVRELDPEGLSRLPDAPEILVAGCGSGRQTALIATRYPHAKITAIDLSQSSLDYAAARCKGDAFRQIEFRKLDLHRVRELNRTFDAVMCTGVLHHLPDPEKGWKVLTEVLRPGGVMHIMVYSKLARLSVRAMRTFLGDTSNRSMSDDLLREVRRQVMEKQNQRLMYSRDFYSLAGVHDLLAHRHEDPFDIPRIKHAMTALDLELLAFALPTPADVARYRKDNPADPHFRDWTAWAALERQNPSLFSHMYDFWCCKKASLTA